MKASLTVLLLVAATVLIGVPTAYGNNCQRCLAYNHNNYNACSYFCRRRLSETDEDVVSPTSSRRRLNNCQRCLAYNYNNYNACGYFCKRRLSETDEDETLALDEDEMVFTKSRRLNYQCQLCKVRNPGYHSACSWVC